MISLVFVLYWNIIFVHATIDVDIMLLLILCCWWGFMASDVSFVFVSRMYTMPIFVFDPRIYKIFLCLFVPTSPGGGRITHAPDLLAW